MSGRPSLFPVEGVARGYAWGSPTAIPELLTTPASGEPVAELWFDAGLPFLLKIIAAEKALSIQVHPNLEQARTGFAREQAQGIPQDAPDRNYRDANHKPELLYALTRFDALCGFRPVAQTLRLFESLSVPELTPVRDALAGRGGLRAAFTTVLATPASERPGLIAAVVAACRRAVRSGGEWLLAASASLLAARDFPGDPGVILTLLLNAVRLEPGEAIFVDAGNVHAYLHGVGVEIMANSDNVLRCGLTPKHIDIPEVLRIADFTSLADPRYKPHSVAGDELVSFAPVPDFELSVLTIHSSGPAGSRELASRAPQILLCTDGAVTVTAGTTLLELGRGHAAFAAAGATARLTGTGTVCQATTPPSSRRPGDG
jgi:mannose-6-phosphate isomerase